MNIWNSMTVTGIDHVFTVPSSRGRRLQIVNRKWYGLSFCQSGQISYTMDGETTVSDRTVAVLLPLGGTYSLHGDKEGEFPLINFQCLVPLPQNKILVTRLRNPEGYLRDFARMEELWRRGKDHAKVMSILYEILSRLSAEDASPSRFLSPATEYLVEHFSDPDLTVSALARTVGLSEPYFRRVFKETYGISPKQYLIDLRIRHAKELLSVGSASVSAVSERCGFSGVYHFCRAFKQATGQTPTEYQTWASG